MAEAGAPPAAGLFARLADRVSAWRTERVSSPGFQSWASRFPLTRALVRHDAARLYDLVAGFVYSQVLLACVELDLLEALRRRPARPEAFALKAGVDPARMHTLFQSAAAIGLFVRLGDGRYRLGRLGAAALGVPGLQEMIRHNRVFYGDLADPVALLRGTSDTALSRFWPYVRDGEADDIPADVAATYSGLMAASQRLVAEETLGAVSLEGISHLIDVGGGTGTFLEAVADCVPAAELTLFDLPPVVEAARIRLAATPAGQRIRPVGGHFLSDPLPRGADAISLVRVLYDHDDAVVAELLARVFAVLPAGGLVLVSEPMSGGAQPSRSGDGYFGFYTMAMGTGRPRSADRHGRQLEKAGFHHVRLHRGDRPFVTCVMTARKPG